MKHQLARSFAAVLAAQLLWAVPGQADDLKVMSIQAMTGKYAFAGVSYENGIKLAFGQADTGPHSITLQEEDYAGDKSQAINLANRAVGEGAIMVLGPTTTVDSLAVAPIFNDSKTPMLSLATANTFLDTGPYSFKMEQSGGDLLPSLTSYLLEKTDIRKVAAIYDRANDGLIDQKNVFAESFAEGGGTVVADEGIAGAESNFLPLVTKLMSSDIDAVFFSTGAEQAANIMIQFRQAGLPDEVKFLGATGISSPRLMEIAGPAAEGTLIISDYVAGVQRPVNEAFEAAYREKFGVEPDQFAAVGYTMGQVALAAIMKAGDEPTREKVREGLMDIGSVPTPLGSGEWSHQDRKPEYGAVVTVVRDGQFAPAE